MTEFKLGDIVKLIKPTPPFPSGWPAYGFAFGICESNWDLYSGGKTYKISNLDNYAGFPAVGLENIGSVYRWPLECLELVTSTDTKNDLYNSSYDLDGSLRTSLEGQILCSCEEKLTELQPKIEKLLEKKTRFNMSKFLDKHTSIFLFIGVFVLGIIQGRLGSPTVEAQFKAANPTAWLAEQKFEEQIENLQNQLVANNSELNHLRNIASINSNALPYVIHSLEKIANTPGYSKYTHDQKLNAATSLGRIGEQLANGIK